jgi:hypothetical protein
MIVPPDNQATVRSLMDAALKTEIQEIVEVVKTVPEPLQLRAFEILLQDAIDRVGGKERSRREEEDDRDVKDKKKDKDRDRESEGLDPNTLPMRVKAFMKRTKVTAPQIEKLFHIEGKQFEPIWAVKVTKFSKAQVQIALLQSLQRALTSGEFSFDSEKVRTECKNKKSYDNTNFKVNFQNNAKYFSGLEKDGLVSLTDDGMTALANLITELAGVEDGK